MPSAAYVTAAMLAPQVPPAAALPFRFVLRTRWSDDDALGVLNNAVYLTLCEEGRLRWCERLGLLRGPGGFPFVLAACTVRFAAPGRGGEDVELRMGTTRLGRSSFQQAYRIARAADGAPWAEAEAVLVCWDAAQRASAPMPEAFRAAILAHEPALARAD
jgi:acyl-CoA thioester hydrolase